MIGENDVSMLPSSSFGFVLDAVDAGLDPCALPLDDSHGFGGSHQAQVVDGQPRLDVVGRLGQHLADFGIGERLVGRWPERQILDRREVHRRDKFQGAGPVEHDSNGGQVVVDGLGRESLVNHVLFEFVQVDRAEGIGSIGGEESAESLEMLLVILGRPSSGLQGFGPNKFLVDVHAAATAGGGLLVFFAILPFGPELELLDEAGTGCFFVASQVAILAVPLAEPLPGGVQSHLGHLDIHGPSVVNGGIRGCLLILESTINPCRSASCNSPSRTRTYDLAVNSLFGCAATTCKSTDYDSDNAAIGGIGGRLEHPHHTPLSTPYVRCERRTEQG